MPASTAVVCDTSVFAAMVFGEPRAGEAYALTRGRRLLAPALLRYEMAQVAVRKIAVAGSAAGSVAQAFAAGLRVRVRLIEPSWPAVVELAGRHHLSAYDAAYLQLALALRVPLATLDERLGHIAEILGLAATAQDT